MEVSSVVNSMQKFIDRLDGLNEEGRECIITFKRGLRRIEINDSNGETYTSHNYDLRDNYNSFEMTDEFMIERTNEEEPILYIKFIVKQDQSFRIAASSSKEVLRKNIVGFKIYTREYVEAKYYNVEYEQVYWINADYINIINTYKGKCSL